MTISINDRSTATRYLRSLERGLEVASTARRRELAEWFDQATPVQKLAMIDLLHPGHGPYCSDAQAHADAAQALGDLNAAAERRRGRYVSQRFDLPPAA